MIGNKEQNHQLKEFISVLLKIRTESEMKNFLEGILTPKELIELPHRLEIVRLLKRGVSQHQIAEDLGVGVATVGRGSRELQKGRFKNV
jgi:TrpR family transcriptional regulator, trp operon repressor